MTLEEALDFWFGRVNFELKSPQPDDLKLDRMRRLLTVLGEPQKRLRIIHVAGSKGKGSTAAMLASILSHAGFRTGLFTSPHLVHVEERIQVDGQIIRPSELAALLTEIRSVSEKERRDGQSLAKALTFFEIATAIGFLHFVRRRADAAVVEVGLGGRFDSTNVCTPLLSILTSISYDHVNILGNTLACIAREKAGIIKPGRPVVSGVRGDDARAVIATVCRDQGAPLIQIDDDFSYHYAPALFTVDEERPGLLDVQVGKETWSGFRLGLIGEHQAANAAVAVTAANELRRLDLPVSDKAIADGLAEVSWPARMQVVGRKPWMILDCAHNVASARALLESLQVSFPLPPDGRRLLLFAGSKDKELAGMLRALAPSFSSILLTRFTDNPRGQDPRMLRNQLPESVQAKTQVVENAREALAEVRHEARVDDLICMTGSVFFAGELLPLVTTPSKDWLLPGT